MEPMLVGLTGGIGAGKSVVAARLAELGAVVIDSDRLAREVGLGAGELFLDFPAKPDMLALDLPLVRRNGTVTQLGGTEAMAHLGLPRVGAELYRSARRLRVFVLRPATVPADAIVRLVMLPREEVLERVEQERALL